MILPVGIALGSNLGDRATEIEAGFLFLAGLSAERKISKSSVMETAPVGCAPGTPSFLNAAVVLEIDSEKLSPRALLRQLQDFERSRGRSAEREPNGPRPLDLDLIFYGDQVLREPGMTIPHPRVAERAFVLKPLAEIAPGLVLPGESQTVGELAVRVGGVNLLEADPSTGSG